MDGATGVWHLQKLEIRYSETGGSSLGVRFYLRYLLKEWKERNPQVEVMTEHSLYQHPQVTAIFRSGEKAKCQMKNLTARQIEDLLNLYRNSQGPNLHLRHGGPRCWTDRRSIQGLWQPSLEAALKQLKWFHKPSLTSGASSAPLRYSIPSLKLAKQHFFGQGRLGAETGNKGFDQRFIASSLKRPFLNSASLVKMIRP